MMIRGVTGGANKGNPIEFTPQEKHPKAVEKFLNSQAPEGKMFLLVKSEIDASKSTHTSKGAHAKGYANNAYQTSGKVWYKTLDIKTDKLYPAAKEGVPFTLSFEDCADDFGVPDVKCVEFKLN